MEKEISLVEHHHLEEMHQNLNRKLLEAQRRDSGERMDSVRAGVLGMVVGESYDHACEDLRSYVAYKSNYPSFQARAERYVHHCCELIQAIKTKRNFPGLSLLSLAKQQEIHEKVLEHFEELKQNLRQIEKVEREQKLSDVRSTVWVLRALSQATVGIVAVALLLDIQGGLFTSFFKVVNVLMDESSAWIVNLFPF